MLRTGRPTTVNARISPRPDVLPFTRPVEILSALDVDLRIAEARIVGQKPVQLDRIGAGLAEIEAGGGAKLDYQAVGILGYQIKPGWTLQLGWRYLSVNYRSNGIILDTISSGIAFGLRIGLR